MADTRPLVLIVDDDPDSREILGDVCRDGGYDVVVCTAAREGLRRTMLERPDVVVLDGHMPNLDGFAAARELKSEIRTRHTPLVIVTADLTPKARELATEAGCDAFVVKPVDPAGFLELLRGLIRPRRAA